MTLNEYIISIVEHNLINYVEDNYTEEEETNYYNSEDYAIHLEYLIETWKNCINETETCNEIDYNHEGTFEELYNYFIEAPCPEFEYKWLEDIFEHHILVDTNVCLK